MALRDFYQLNEPAVLSTTDSFASTCNLPGPIVPSKEELTACTAAEPAQAEAEPASAIAQVLASEMEACRQQLLDLLVEYPPATQLLAEQLWNSQAEGVDFSMASNHKSMGNDIVQDYGFVQPDINSLYTESLQRNMFRVIQLNTAQIEDLRQFPFFPALLLRIAEQIEKTAKVSLTIDPGYIANLRKSRCRLQAVRQQMISSNTGLVAFVAYKYKTTNLSFDDLMQEGIVGLIKAVDRFDPKRGICFSTYAVFWIKQAISRLIVKQEKVVRLPVALAEKASVIFEMMRVYYLENSRWPNLVDLQAQCGLTMEEVKTVSSYYQATHSLDAGLSEEGDDHTLMDTLEQQQFPSPLEDLMGTNLSLFIGNLVSTLPEKEAAILNMRFGLKNHTEMTLQAIADQLQVTRERVRQIQNQALNKIKQQYGNDLMPFLEVNES